MKPSVREWLIVALAGAGASKLYSFTQAELTEWVREDHKGFNSLTDTELLCEFVSESYEDKKGLPPLASIIDETKLIEWIELQLVTERLVKS